MLKKGFSSIPVEFEIGNREKNESSRLKVLRADGNFNFLFITTFYFRRYNKILLHCLFRFGESHVENLLTKEYMRKLQAIEILKRKVHD